MSEGVARNALGGERSPFLKHGATQPVNWLPWGDAAFERARSEDRPVLLDIGAVWCHWCHVMDRESYDDEDTAALINELFVPVKVDRDERPDVDARYQRAVQLLTGQGGWPLTAFLTPDGEPFYAGTYFPPVDSHGRPSFRRVLQEVARVWRDERDRAGAAAQGIAERVAQAAAAEAQPGAVSDELVTEALEELAHSFDFRYGGFGRAPKFPHAGGIDLLLDEAVAGGTDWAARIVEDTLDAMIRGGFHDQLGGGFHRYSTDARWIIPHFEKMAYDNGVLLATCARSYAVSGNPLHRSAAAGVLAYYRDVAADLIDAGGFPASQDADHSPDDDGDYWTWSRDELRAALGDDELVRTASAGYGFEDAASAMPVDRTRHVLFRAMEPDALAARLDIDADTARERMAQIRQRLKAVRDSRPRPFVDETLYTGWVGLVASGYLAVARHMQRADARDDAVRALERIWRDAWRGGRGLLHRAGDDASGYHIDDQAHVMLACIDAFEVTQSGEWLRRASDLGDVIARRFADPGNGALHDRPRDEPAAIAALDRPYLPVADAPSPSGNGSAALAYLRLHALTGDEAAAARGRAILSAFGGSARRLGSAAATFVKAVAWTTRPITTVVVVEAGADGELLGEALRCYRPRTVVRRHAPGLVDADTLPPELRAMVTGDAPRAYVCAGRSCAAPVSTAAALAGVLRTLRG